MYKFAKTKIISKEFSVDDVFGIIVDISKYKDFVPFCSRVDLIEDCISSDGYFIADLSLEVIGIKYTYRSKTALHKTQKKGIISTTGESKDVLKYLKSDWIIEKMEDGAIKIEYDILVDLSVNLPFLPVEKMLQTMAEKIVDSFEKRLYSLKKNG